MRYMFNTKKSATSFKTVVIWASFIVIGYAVILTFLRNDTIPRMIFSDLASVVIGFLVALTLIYAAKVSAVYGRRVQVAWGLLAVSVLSYIMGDIIWSILELGLNQNPFPSVADIFYLSFYPLFAMGIYYLPRTSFNQSEKLKIIIEMGIVIITLGLIYWTFLIVPTISNQENLFAGIVSTAYIIGDFLLLFVLVRLLYIKLEKVYHGPVMLLGMSIIVQIAADSIYSLQSIQGTYISGGLLDTGWILGLVLIGLAAFLQASKERYDIQKYFKFRFWLQRSDLTSYLILIWVMIAFILLIWAVENRSIINLEVIVLGVGLVILLILTRLIISLNENKNLYLAAINEIKVRKKIEKELKESEAYYRMIFENTGAATVIIEENTKISLANAEFEKLSGYSREELEGNMSWTDFVVKGELETMREYHELRRTHPKTVPSQYDFRFIDRKGNIKYIHLYVDLIPGTKKSVASLIDITERRKAEKEIETSLREKEVLLREIHHRVKNNLQIVSSLMNLQTKFVDDQESVNLLRESQSRVKSMAIIHELLYQTKSLAKIDLSKYVSSLVSYLFDSYMVDPRRIKLNVDMEEVLVNIDTAIPCGLIINELVSNSLKHAFPEGFDGEITIRIHDTDGEYDLTISDNGVGFPSDLNFRKTDSLGLQLVNSLVGQLDGTIELDRSHGTEFRIKFNELEYKKRT